MRFANPGWLFALVPGGLACVGPDPALTIGLERPRQLLELMVEGVEVESLRDLTGMERRSAEALLGRLTDREALLDHPPFAPPESGVPLVDAVLERGGTPELVWTAEEALVLPANLDREIARRAVRALVAGSVPHLRLFAYSLVARSARRTVWGDVPEQTTLARGLDAVEGAGADAICVVDLRTRRNASVSIEDLGRLGVGRAHRLGPILDVAPVATTVPGVSVCAARFAAPDLRFVRPRELRSASGFAASIEKAEMIARVEAIERYAAGRLAGRALVRARAGELAGAVEPSTLFRLNRRQYERSADFEPCDPEAGYLWTPAATSDGARRWVAAEAVFYPFRDTERVRRVARASSSGVAAHSALVEARTRAVCELVERDAFVWTWVQRLSRERIDRAGLPPAVTRSLEAVAARGHQVEFVNLTLETAPVVLCVVLGEETLRLGAGCSRHPLDALTSALREATAFLAGEGEVWPTLAPEQVTLPADHVSLHQDATVIEEDGFLFASSETIALGEIPPEPRPVEAVAERIGEPVFVDLSCAASDPMFVSRALVPDLIPLVFGWDEEPLGMPRLAEPKTTIYGRTIGRSLDLGEAGPLTPHPFP